MKTKKKTEKKVEGKFKEWLWLVVGILFLLVLVGLYHSYKPLPEGVSFEGEVYNVSEDDIDFLYDLTYYDQEQRIMEQEIFENVFSIVDGAEKFIVIDMFLFNSDYAGKDRLINLSGVLKDKLIAKKNSSSDVEIVFITDHINNFYGSYTSDEINALEDAGVNVVITDSKKLRDSNPYYSSIWRTYFQWFGSRGSGILNHPLGKPDQKVTIRSFLNLINTKANHRKVIVADSNGDLASIVMSANPHDASSMHSNIGFLIKGKLGEDLIKSEEAVVRFSGGGIEEIDFDVRNYSNGSLEVQVLTEGKIKKSILRDIDNMSSGESIDLAMFYLSDRDIVKALLEASSRGVSVRIILDPNKDAFAREKNGIPNRPVAHELVSKSEGAISIRWYETRGEQFHTKLLILHTAKGMIVYGGSPNYTKRNLGDLNLETSLRIFSVSEGAFVGEVKEYFDRIWYNEGANYTLDFGVYEESSSWKKLVYRFQEFSGFSSF